MNQGTRKEWKKGITVNPWRHTGLIIVLGFFSINCFFLFFFKYEKKEVNNSVQVEVLLNCFDFLFLKICNVFSAGTEYVKDYKSMNVTSSPQSYLIRKELTFEMQTFRTSTYTPTLLRGRQSKG